MIGRIRISLACGLGFVLVLAIVSVAALSMHTDCETSSGLKKIAKDFQNRKSGTEIDALRAEIERLRNDRLDSNRLSSKMKTELTSLQSQLGEIKKRQQSIGKRIDQMVQYGNERTKGVGWDEDAIPLTPEEKEAQEIAQAQARIDLIKQATLKQEPDRDWSDSATSTLAEKFQSEEMKGIYLVGAECRRTLCRIELSFDWSLPPEQSFSKLLQFSPWLAETLIEMNEDTGLAVVYLAREGYALPLINE